jgi:uncharacterized protein
MALQVGRTDDPSEAMAQAGPVDHNVVLTLLADRIASGDPGRYWWTTDGGEVSGFALRTPRHFFGSLVPMARPETDALAEALHDDDDRPLPGVIGDTATAAAFAGRWTELSGAGGRAGEAQRLYRLDPAGLVEPPPAPGRLRTATSKEVDLLVDWMHAFERDTGMPSPGDPRPAVTARVAAERLWVWDDGGPACVAMATPAIGGVSRVGFVYTPDERRGRGYAAQCVAGLSRHLLATEAEACMLFTQLSNPTSNGVYRRLGYRAVAEILSFDLEPPGDRR